MAQYEFIADDQVLGANPPGLKTDLWTTPETVEIIEDAQGRKILNIEPGASIDTRQVVVLENSNDSVSNEIRMYVEFIWRGLTDFRTIIRASGSVGSESGGSLGNAESKPTSTEGRIIYYSNGGLSNVNMTQPSDNSVPAVGAITSMLTETVGSQAKVKWWPQGDAEPLEWASVTSYKIKDEVGYAGVNLYDGSLEVVYIGVGTGGDEAPRPTYVPPPAETDPTGLLVTVTPNGTSATWAGDSAQYNISRERFRAVLEIPPYKQTPLTTPMAGEDAVHLGIMTDPDASSTASTYNHHFDGTGVRIYVIDAGVQPDHVEFPPERVAPGINTVGMAMDGNTDDTDTTYTGHGTQIASLAAGENVGVARGATIVPIRVKVDSAHDLFDSPIEWFTAGIQWIIDNHPKGTPGVALLSQSTWEQGLHDEGGLESEKWIRKLLDAGIVFVQSSGNQGRNTDRYITRMDDVIAAGCTNSSLRFTGVGGGPNYGPHLTVSTPVQGPCAIWSTSKNNRYKSADTSTSNGAGITAGVCAVYLSANPTATPKEVQRWLIESSFKDKITSFPPESVNRLTRIYFWGEEMPGLSTTEQIDDGSVRDFSRYRYRVSGVDTAWTDWAEVDIDRRVTDSGVVTIDAIPVEGAVVTAQHIGSGAVAARVVTGAGGAFSLKLLPGRYRIAWSYLDAAGDFGVAGTRYGKANPDYEVV